MKACRLLLLAVVLLALVGCGESDAATLKGPLQYGRDGGLAGVSERLTIQKDGRARVSGGTKGARSFKLPKKDLERIARLLRESGFAHLKSTKDLQAADAFVYSITYRGHTVKCDDPTIPDELVDLLTALGRIVVKYGGGSG